MLGLGLSSHIEPESVASYSLEYLCDFLKVYHKGKGELEEERDMPSPFLAVTTTPHLRLSET